MAEQVRAFLALEIPERVRAELAASREALRPELPRARWVRPEGQHLTLKFLGRYREGGGGDRTIGRAAPLSALRQAQGSGAIV